MNLYSCIIVIIKIEWKVYFLFSDLRLNWPKEIYFGLRLEYRWIILSLIVINLFIFLKYFGSSHPINLSIFSLWSWFYKLICQCKTNEISSATIVLFFIPNCLLLNPRFHVSVSISHKSDVNIINFLNF